MEDEISDDENEIPCSQKRLVYIKAADIDDDAIEEELGRFLDQLIKEWETQKEKDSCNNDNNN